MEYFDDTFVKGVFDKAVSWAREDPASFLKSVVQSILGMCNMRRFIYRRR